MVDEAPDPLPAARAVGTLLAPVVARLRGDDEGYDVLLAGAIEDGGVPEAVCAAPKVARVYLRLAPPPDGSSHIVHGFAGFAGGRFPDEIATLGAECLAIARVPREVGDVALVVFGRLALEHGERSALEGAIASVWWAASESARMRAVDPIEETAAICRYLARVA
jgi:hypothetical protein